MARYFRNKWFLLFLLIPFFKPVCFQYYTKLSILETIFVVWKIISAMIGVFSFFIYIEGHAKIPKLVVYTVLFEGSILVSTYLHQGDLIKGIIDGVSVISFLFIFILGIKYHLSKFFYILEKLLKVLMMTNLLTMVLFPNGLNADLYTNDVNALYFMVIDNGSALFLSFCMLIFIIESYLEHGHISKNCKVSIIACMISAILSFSATAIFSMLLIWGIIFFTTKSNVKSYINPKNLMFVYVGLFLFLMTMQENAVMQFILNYVFQRSSNFSGRYILWEQAIALIKREPLLGYGRTANDYIQAWGGYFSSHNYVLEILLQGGLVALYFFLSVIILALKRLQRKKLSFYILIIFWGMLIAAMMESAVHSVYIFGTICICCYSGSLECIQGSEE